MVRRIYFNKNMTLVVFKNAGHRGAIVAENAYYYEDPSQLIQGFNKSDQIEEIFYNSSMDLNKLINTGFNFSRGHYQNRVNKKHTKYGHCTMVIIANRKSKSIRKRVTQVVYVVHYDCFK